MSEDFWMHTVNGLTNLGTFALTVLAMWIGYLKLKAGQMRNANDIGDVRELVNGSHSRMVDKMESMQGRLEAQNQTIATAVEAKAIADEKLAALGQARIAELHPKTGGGA